MKTNIIFAVLCLGVLGAFIVLRGRVAPTPPAFAQGAMTLQEATALAKEQGKVVFAVASADWCPSCQSYKRGALADSEVGAWLAENAITLTLDVTDRDTPNQDAAGLGVSSIPVSFIIDENGQTVARAGGTMSASELKSWLNEHTSG